MKSAFLLLPLVALLLAAPARANEEVGFPEEGPLITLTLPEGWVYKHNEGVLQAAASEDLDTMLIVRPLEATKKEGSQALEEIKAPLDKTYGEAIEYDKLEEGGTENLGFYILNATAKTQTGNEGVVNSYIVSIMITFPDSDQLLLAQFLSTEKGAQDNAEAIVKIIQSLKKVE